MAFNKAATQSSNYNFDGEILHAHLAVDGNPYPYIHLSNSSCSHTALMSGIVNAWWKVDLANQYRIEAISIQNRGEGLGMSYFI